MIHLLTDLSLRPVYVKGQDDVARDFYLPVMAHAARYDRAVGFFSSTIYVISWSSLRKFVERGGRMRAVCSPVLRDADSRAIAEGYAARVRAEQAQRLQSEIQHMLTNPYLEKPTRVLASLVALGVVDFRIAFMEDKTAGHGRRLFHDKVGIVSDNAGNTVVFKGSMNETWTGLAPDGNLESVDVFTSWGNEAERISLEVECFDSLWHDRFPDVSVRPFPDIALDELLKAADVANWEHLTDEIAREVNTAALSSADRAPGGRVPMPHQVRALEEWNRRGRRGIFEHATGSGKTFTAMCAIRGALEQGEVPLILVPTTELLRQWHDELERTFADVQPQVLLCGAGHTSWRQRLVRPWTSRASSAPRIVLATMRTASNPAFVGAIDQGAHVFLVADEVHRLGSPEYSRGMCIESGPRLGLSATPRRYGDPAGTDRILDYFGGVVPPPFTLEDAIRVGALVPYVYVPQVVDLTDEEQAAWDRLSVRARRLRQRLNKADASPDLQAALARLYIARARLLKGAAGKVDLALRVLRDSYAPGQSWLVYCDDQRQMRAVLDVLRGAGMDASEYHSSMTGDREQTLVHFAANGGILVSIRCLDEGVNIPSVSHALILASSKNPREFIQRRGRILRKAPGKHLAYLFDAIVVPAISSERDHHSQIFDGEMARAISFGTLALNPGAIGDLERIAVALGVDYHTIKDSGVEEDENWRGQVSTT